MKRVRKGGERGEEKGGSEEGRAYEGRLRGRESKEGREEREGVRKGGKRGRE